MNELELMGYLQVSKETLQVLNGYAETVGDMDLSNEQTRHEDAGKIARMIQLIVSTREYQFA